MVFTPELLVHTVAGGASLIAGPVALVTKKGGRLHRIAGITFAVSMLIVAAVGAYLGVVGPMGISASLVGGLVFYLVVSGWLTVGQRNGSIGAPELSSCLLGVAIAAALVAFVLTPPDAAAGGSSNGRIVVMAAIAILAVTLDLSVVLRRGISGVARMSRHVWRICMTLFLATLFFFPGQQDIFAGVPLAVLAVPPLAVMVAMTFWLVRVRLAVRLKTID